MSELIVNTITTDQFEGEVTVDRKLRVTGSLQIDTIDDTDTSTVYSKKVPIVTDNNIFESINFNEFMKALSPPGLIMPFGGDTVPAGWLLCNGDEINRNTYSDLFTAIGVKWGSGDGSTTFKLPDLRGQFLRGLDEAGNNDPGIKVNLDEVKEVDERKDSSGNVIGGVVGSYQEDAFQGHVFYSGVPMPYNYPNHTIYGITYDETPGMALYRMHGNAGDSLPTFGQAITSLAKSDETNGVPKVSSETRPQNAAVNFIIKY